MGDNPESTRITIPMEVALPHIQTPESEIPPSGSTEPPLTNDTPPPPANDESDGGSGQLAKDICLIVLVIIVFIIIIPLFLLYAFAVYLICNKGITEDTVVVPQAGKKRIYQKVQEFQETAVRIAKLALVIHSRIMVLLLIWLIINISVRSLRRKIVLGSELWKWSLLIVIFSCGYPVIDVIVRISLHYFTKLYINNKNVVYLARGSRMSINLIIFSISVLLTWVFYFCSPQGLRDTSNTDIIFHIVKWSLTSLLIFSFCWLLKTVLLLKWKAHAVYNRFRDRILRAGFQLYFLACISGTYWDIFKPKEKGEAEKNGHGRNGHEPEKTELPENMRGLERKPTIEKTNVERVKSKKEMEEENRFIKDIKRHMLSEEATTYDIKHMAKKFVTLAKLSSRDQDDDIFEILEECQNNFPHDHGDISKEDLLKFEVDENEAELLYVELQGENHSATVSYETLEKWMVRAHKNCLALGYTLIDAKEVVNCLNKLMSGVVIIAVILSWLFLMKIATTKLIVLIASPLLAATFIFGDTCKTLFEGIIFAFVRHPFDVGDRCIIDGIEMEVKQLGILSTTFLKIGGREESIYPNSVLVTKPSDNLKGDPDPNDCIELNLDPTTDKSQIDELEKKIKKYLELDRGVKYDDYCRTVIKGIGNNIRTAVHFKHTMSTLDVTHSQCYGKKNKQRSELLLELKQFLQDLNIKAATN